MILQRLCVTRDRDMEGVGCRQREERAVAKVRAAADAGWREVLRAALMRVRLAAQEGTGPPGALTSSEELTTHTAGGCETY